MNGTLLQTLTGSSGVGNSFNSSGRDIYIHFTSDDESSSNLGFEIQYEAGKHLIESINKKTGAHFIIIIIRQSSLSNFVRWMYVIATSHKRFIFICNSKLE